MADGQSRFHYKNDERIDYGPIVYWHRISGFHPEEAGSIPARAIRAARKRMVGGDYLRCDTNQSIPCAQQVSHQQVWLGSESSVLSQYPTELLGGFQARGVAALHYWNKPTI